MKKVPVWHDLGMEAHFQGGGHPESPARLRAAFEALEGHPAVEWQPVTPAEPVVLTEVHDPAYVERVLASRGQTVVFDPDTVTSPESVESALLAVGAARAAVDAVIDGPHRRAFALVRPPGHHAERDRAMGFCLFNNVALAATRARARGLSRILIVDWDVHHGNGTQHLFERDASVLFFSSHQGGGFYPGTGLATERGRDDAQGATINVPLAAGAGHAELIEAFERHLVPAADAFRPELVLISAGFDAHVDDPLGGLRATEQTFAALTRIVAGLADRHAEGRLVLVLEGGYDLGALGRSVRAVVDALAA